MRIAVLSDIHGNAEALDAVLHAVDAEDAECIVCLGDLVGYGPEPDECVRRIFEKTDRIVAGNHDFAAVGKTSTMNFTRHAKQAVEWTEKILSDASRQRLNGLPLIQSVWDAQLVHATPDKPDRWHYMIETSHARRSLKSMNTDICLTGHTHRPGAFVRNGEGLIHFQDATSLPLINGQTYIINAGSVGQPRDGDPRACFGILDTEERRFVLRRVSYPIENTQRKMLDLGLPEFLIDRLSLGW